MMENQKNNDCFANECSNDATTEFCPECLLNGGIKPRDFTNPELENRFMYHSPKEGQPEKYTAIREKAKELAYLIDAECPNSREKSVAMTNLETAVMWANASIARN